MKVTVEPVVVTMAVRYCLGRSSYAPGLIAGQVIAAWPTLGKQQEIILRDIRGWLAEDWHAHPEADVWRWLLTQLDSCPDCMTLEKTMHALGFDGPDHG